MKVRSSLPDQAGLKPNRTRGKFLLHPPLTECYVAPDITETALYPGSKVISTIKNIESYRSVPLTGQRKYGLLSVFGLILPVVISAVYTSVGDWRVIVQYS